MSANCASEADDPAMLRKRIADLEHQLAVAQATVRGGTVDEAASALEDLRRGARAIGAIEGLSALTAAKLADYRDRILWMADDIRIRLAERHL